MSLFEGTTSTKTSLSISHTNTYSWKSVDTIRAEEFARVQRLVKHIAPEQFRNPAKPTNGPCEIMPTNVLEHLEHDTALLVMATEQKVKNMAAKKAAKELTAKFEASGEIQRPIRSRFGEHGKAFMDGLSSVLSLPTIWCTAHTQFGLENAQWPTLVEFQECGDRRENETVATRCGRYLPIPCQKYVMPVHDVFGGDRCEQIQFYVQQKYFPLDKPGPLFSVGPSPAEADTANSVMNSSAEFEARSRFLLGDTAEEIGKWQEPFVPDWLAEQRNRAKVNHMMPPVTRKSMQMVPYVPYRL